jgi:integrase
MRIHDLRYTAAALAIASGVHPKLIQAMLGHANIGITMDTYGHLFESLAVNAADALNEGYRAAEGRDA